MSKRSSHEDRKEMRNKIRSDDELISEYTAVDAFLELLSQHNMMDWQEYAYEEYGRKLCSNFSDEDWQALKNRLPYMSVGDKKKLVICLGPHDRNDLMILQELIHTDDTGLFDCIMDHLYNNSFVFDFSAEIAVEFMEKALRLLAEANSFEQRIYLQVIEKYRDTVPEAIQRRIPAQHQKRFSVSLSTGESKTVTIDVSDAALDHASSVISVNMLSPEMRYGIVYGWKQKCSTREIIELDIEANCPYAEFVMTFI